MLNKFYISLVIITSSIPVQAASQKLHCEEMNAVITIDFDKNKIWLLEKRPIQSRNGWFGVFDVNGSISWKTVWPNEPSLPVNVSVDGQGRVILRGNEMNDQVACMAQESFLSH